MSSGHDDNNKDKLPATAPRQRRAPDGRDVGRDRAAVVERELVHYILVRFVERDAALGVGTINHADIPKTLRLFTIVEDDRERPVVDRKFVGDSFHLISRVVKAHEALQTTNAFRLEEEAGVGPGQRRGVHRLQKIHDAHRVLEVVPVHE